MVYNTAVYVYFGWWRIYLGRNSLHTDDRRQTTDDRWQATDDSLIFSISWSPHWFFIRGGECRKPIIPCTVQGYFWRAQPRSDATHVKRPDHWVRSEVGSSPHHQVMRWQVCHLSTTSSPQCRTAFLHRRSVLDRPNTSDFMCISLEVRARYTSIQAL